MGLNIGFSNGKTDPPNPDPQRFELIEVQEADRYTLAIVRYPGCPTFNGCKLLLFEGVSAEQLRQSLAIDPHFAEGGHIVARFEPTPRGLSMATSVMMQATPPPMVTATVGECRMSANGREENGSF